MAKKHIRKRIDTSIPLSKRVTKKERYLAISKISRMKRIRKFLSDGGIDVVYFVERELERGEFTKKTEDGKLDTCYSHGIWLINEMSRASENRDEEREFYEKYVKPSRGYKKLLREISRIIKVLELMLRRLGDKRG